MQLDSRRKGLYQWSADRIGKFPLSDDDLNKDYEPVIASDRFIPLSAVDENDNVVGHLFIRYPNELNASKITLGVFTNNDSARHCYEAVGFRSIGKTEIYKMSIGEWECIEMELSLVQKTIMERFR